MPTIRVAEVLAALSLTTDLASGVPFEKGLATCAVSTAFAQVLGLDTADRHAVFHTALLRAVGCTAYAPENSAFFVDDTAFQAALKAIDPGDPAVFGAQMARFGDWAGPQAQPVLAQRFLDIAATEGVRATGSACEVSRALGPRLGLPTAAVDALDHVLERWDGLGMPGRCSGEDLPLIARIVHLGEQAAWAHAQGGRAAAVAEVRRRSGGHLDPDLATRFVDDADAVLAALDGPDLLAAVVAAEPGNPATVGPDGLAALCEALAIVVDLKGRYLLGHSAHVATLTDAAAALSGVAAADRAELRAAALVHDLGRAGVASSIWDRPGPLGAADWERVRLHDGRPPRLPVAAGPCSGPARGPSSTRVRRGPPGLPLHPRGPPRRAVPRGARHRSRYHPARDDDPALPGRPLCRALVVRGHARRPRPDRGRAAARVSDRPLPHGKANLLPLRPTPVADGESARPCSRG